MMAALTLRPSPQARRGACSLRLFGFRITASWWIFLYIFIVLPWMYAAFLSNSTATTTFSFTNTQNMIIVGGFGYLWLKSSGAWRLIYANLMEPPPCTMIASLTINVALEYHLYYTGSLYDLPLVSSFLWFALAGAIAYQKREELDAPSGDASDTAESENSGGESVMLLGSRWRPCFPCRFSQSTRFGTPTKALQCAISGS